MTWGFIREDLPLRHPSVFPLHAGWYVRDWRGTQVLLVEDRTLTVDWWNPVPDARDILCPGVWYVLPDINDANEQRLPWRVPTNDELALLACLFPRECRQMARETNSSGVAVDAAHLPSAARSGVSFF